MIEFDKERIGTGTKEWADHVENICLGCSNNCRYCYAAQNAARFKRRDRDGWAREEITAKASIVKYPSRAGVIMFPSAHDLTPGNFRECIQFLRKVLEAGNSVLIVSKPNPCCMAELREALSIYRENVLFRFTIGTTDAPASLFWEPGAPLPKDRIAALYDAFKDGWRTSVSMEPLLGGVITARSVIKAVEPFATDSIWIGKMNKIRTRVKIQKDVDREMVEFIESRQTDKEMLRLFLEFQDNPKIFWKDSIREVVSRITNV